MEVAGYNLLLQDFCQYCPDFVAETESIDCSGIWGENPRVIHNIRCQNRKRCARIADNIRNQV